MTERNDDYFAAELGGDVPEIDIHGLDRRNAIAALEEFLQNAFMREDRVVRVIHGRGAGVLKTEVARMLDEHKLIESWRPSMNPKEVGAVTLAKLIAKQ